MAITEANKLKIEGDNLKEQVQYCRDLIKAAARYERLCALKDFSDMMEDLKRLKEVHEGQIKGWTEQLEGVSYFKSMRLLEVIKVHQIRANQLKEAINYIPKLIYEADLAREFLKSQVKEDSADATRN